MQPLISSHTSLTLTLSPGAAGFCAFAPEVGLELEPFQREIAHVVLDGPPEALVLLPRGQGKSRLMGAVAVHHLLTVPKASVYLAAASREQAAVVFEYARDVAQHPALGGALLVRHLELRAPDGGRLRVVASDAPKLHGLTPTLAVVDELHAHRDAEVYLALRTALLKRPGARMVTITTAGQGVDSPLGLLRSRGLALPHVERQGAITRAHGPGLAMLEWAAPEDADPADLDWAKAANPASWIDRDGLASQRDALPELAWRRYHLNQWTARAGAWLPAGAWQACVGRPSFTPGEPVWIGVDVGGTRANSAVVWVNSALQVGAAIYQGERGILDCIEQVRELAGLYAVQEVIFDPWRFGQAALELEAEGLRTVAFPQSDSRMVPASAALHRAIVERAVVLPDDPRMAEHAANCVQRHSRRGWRLDTPDRSSPIDSLVALCMALQRAQTCPAEVKVLGWL